MNLKNTKQLEEAIEIDLKRKATLDKFQEAWKALLAEIKVELTRVSFDSMSLGIHFAGTKHELEAVWGTLRRFGFEPPEHRPKAKDSSYNGLFIRETDNCKVYLFFSSTVCRQVKVGMKMVEQPVYETVCGETDLTPLTGVVRQN
jgi:hypothetical protein